MADPAALEVHLVVHTHWDREWYLPAGRFRQRLVALIDELLADDAETSGSFLLDGQAVVLDDYLAIRPERAAELAARLRAGTLEAGPWFVLPDELIPSGEALVRNLLAGRRTLRALRAEAPAVLYCPDSFGHPAALPLLARGFGCSAAIVWRGFGGSRWPPGDVFRWRAPDGSAVLMFHLPREGYGAGANLPRDEGSARARWSELRSELAPRARLGLVLLQNGADHHARQTHIAAATQALARAAMPDHLVPSSLRRFGAALVERARGASLPEIAGELRDSYGYAWTLQGTFSSRAAQKRRNTHIERLLLREVEPWCALARLRSAASRRQLVDAAWRSLLLCHPHDTLCGCSIDEVARAMEARLDDAETQAFGLREDALLDLIGHDAAVARETPEHWRRVLLVRNPAARVRGGVAEVEILEVVQDVPVGPGSGAVAPAMPRLPRVPSISGGVVPLQILGSSRRHDRVESPRHFPRNSLVESVRAVAWVAPLGGYATRAYTVGDELSLAPQATPAVSATADSIVSESLRVTAAASGRIELADRRSGREISSLLWFESVAEGGDLYTHSPLGEPATAATCLGVRSVDRGPLRATLELRWRMAVPRPPRPRSVSEHRSPWRGRRGTVTLGVRLGVDAGSDVLRIGIAGENRARGHRLRVVVATGIDNPQVHADAAFGPVRRERLEISEAERAMEAPPATAPLHRYVSLFGGAAGATVFSDGLAEYEVRPNGEVAVTLLRGVGQLSRNDLPERPGHAGWPVPTPEAQSLGPFAAGLALLLHGPRSDATLDAIERAADDVLLPIRGGTLRSVLEIPAPTEGVTLEGEGLAFSTVKESEDGAWTVLRCVNVTEGVVRGAWRLPARLREAWHARLDETPLEQLEVEGGTIRFTAPQRAVVTILAR